MIINEILGSGVKKAQKARKKEFRKELDKVPKMAKMLRTQIQDKIAEFIDTNPGKEAEVPKMITKMVNDSMDYKKFKLPEFQGDFTNNRALRNYLEDAIEAKVKENYEGGDDASGRMDSKMKDHLEKAGLTRAGMTHNIVGKFLIANGYAKPEQWMKNAEIRPSGEKVMSKQEYAKLKDYLAKHEGKFGTG